MTKTIRAVSLALLPVAWPALASAQTTNSLNAQERSQGWQLLFDGKSLNGWHPSVPAQPAPSEPARTGRVEGRGGRAATPQPEPPRPPQAGGLAQVGPSPKPCTTAAATSGPAGASHWEVVDGLLVACGAPAGYLTSDASYRDFVLSIEFRCGDETNSGVFVRSPAENGGYGVQIGKQQPAGYNTGAIVNTAKTARDFRFKPDEWNRFEITADGDHLVVVLNGETTLDVRDAKFREGNLRLQYQQFPIAFRNIKLRPIR